MAIYTRTGDAGTTSLFTGQRVSKTHPRVEAYGTLDELNAALSLCACAAADKHHRALLEAIQQQIFWFSAELASDSERPSPKQRYLFAGNIMENIRYGRPDATDEEVIRAAKLANAHDFIMEMPDNYGTDIGQRGVKLSGGQKQRLSIARAFLKNPPILIFDEATSALDNESEKVVQQSLERLAKDRTTFVIAHRLSTIRNARRILVLTEEGIAEEGTHQELMEKDGVF